jgi:ribosomal protein S18 acetylase RimI-like enzyme
MPDLKYFPISHYDETSLTPIMEEEEKMWMSDLGWDYSTIRLILASFVKNRQLPGYVAVNSQKVIGYTYYLINQTKGILGALYASETNRSQEAVEQLLARAISHLKDFSDIRRIESQIMPFHNLSIPPTFTQHGFDYFPRYYLVLRLDSMTENSDVSSEKRIVPWNSGYLVRAAEMTVISYCNQTDAEICEDYRTKPGCENYLRSLVENPGCGFFMPKASFISLDERGTFCGFLICSRISTRVAMIPQIAVHPSHQGRGVGTSLIYRSLRELKSLGFQSVSLMVSRENRRAFDWYRRVGFRMRKEFGAYVWQRQPNYE